MRLPSHLRMKHSRDFARVRAEGASHPGRYLVLGVLRDASLKHFRFGLITPRKLGIAVVRNKIRRRLREIIRLNQARIADGCYLVTIARWKAPEADYGDLEKDWLRLAKKAGVLLPEEAA
jgi:ribonuclease P protein component